MIIIGIAGGTGSGKTTVVRKIVNSLAPGEVTPSARFILQRYSHVWRIAATD